MFCRALDRFVCDVPRGLERWGRPRSMSSVNDREESLLMGLFFCCCVFVIYFILFWWNKKFIQQEKNKTKNDFANRSCIFFFFAFLPFAVDSPMAWWLWTSWCWPFLPSVLFLFLLCFCGGSSPPLDDVYIYPSTASCFHFFLLRVPLPSISRAVFLSCFACFD